MQHEPARDWRDRAGPWARAVLPDGQELDVVVTARYRAPGGAWWYECEAILPARHENAEGHTRPVAAPTAISVPADHITPLPGEDYTTLPTEGAVTGRQWVLEQLRDYTTATPTRRLHRRDCWQPTGPITRITTPHARTLYTESAATPCDTCRPDRALGDGALGD